MFKDTDDTGVCPKGHDTRAVDDEDRENYERVRGARS